MTRICWLYSQKMLKVALCLLVGVFWLGSVSCSIKCPDGQSCPDVATCCKTDHGYGCCPYPNAVCCPDLASCCPSGFVCNLSTRMCEKKSQPWMNVAMVKKVAAEDPSTPDLPASPPQDPKNNPVPDQQKSLVVHCDNYYQCPDRTTCCRHPRGGWTCCPYSPATCCLDGYHCCPFGYDCDYTYTHCVRQGLRYPFGLKYSLSSILATPISEDKSSLQEQTPMTALTDASADKRDPGVIRCDSEFYCSQGTSCCTGPQGQWSCCPYRLGQCCADGQHCCEYGYTCNLTTKSCDKLFF